MRGLRTTVTLVLACLGCRSQRYPPEWSPPVTHSIAGVGTRCPLLSGHYADRGWSSPQYTIPLMRVFGTDPGTRWRGGGRATIAQFGDDSLVVSVADTARSGEDSQPSKTAKRRVLRQKDGDYSCGPEGLELAEWDVAAADVIAALSRMRYRVRRSVDGALVVQMRETGIGLLLVVPVGAREDWWFRFPPLP